MASTADSGHLEGGDVSPAGSRTRRESLTRWIARTTGHHLDARSDKGFCEGLWDGVVLCRVLNALAPGVVPDALRADDPRLRGHDSPDAFLRRHNYERFVAGAARVGVKDGDMFALRDLGGVTGTPGDVLRCLEAVRAAVGDAKTTPSSRGGECATPTTAATNARAGEDAFSAPRRDAETVAFETPPPTVYVPDVDFARAFESRSTEARTDEGASVRGDPSLSPSRGVPSLARGDRRFARRRSPAEASSSAEVSSRRFPTTPPDTDGSAGSSFASPRSSSCSTVRCEEPNFARRRGSGCGASLLGRRGGRGSSAGERRGTLRAARDASMDVLSAELESAESVARAMETAAAAARAEYERRLEDAARELAGGRARLSEAFRREARATAGAEDAERRAEKALVDADRLSRENAALRLEKEAWEAKEMTTRAESLDADGSSPDNADAPSATTEASLGLAARERDEAFRELEATRETLASAMCAATDAQTESRRVAARLLDTETALRDVRDVTVPSLRGALAALRRDAALARDAFSATFAGRLFAATSRLAATSALYEKAAAENKKLHFAIQDLKGSIRVFCRVRPAVPGMDDEFDENAAAPAVEATTERDLVATRRERRGEDAKLTRRSFSFDRAFGPTASQAEVYEACGPLIRCVADGYNVCLLAYGQTRSGKTHTMSGPPRGRDEDADATESRLGVNYRALDDVFRVVRARDAVAEHVVTVSVLEIYNEECRDLLAPRGGTKIDVAGFASATNPERASRNRIGRETAADVVPDAVARVARDAEDVFAVMCEGEANRSTGATAMNARSSRSHSVVIVRVRAVSRETRAQTRGALYLVDLAGSERVARSEASGDRLKEARHINKSLSALGDVVAALQEKRAHVPYRNSKLTTLLRGALGPNGKAALFAHVSPAPASADESVSTLAFAERAAAVELGKPARVVESVSSSAPNEESARSRRDLAEMRARLEASEQRARDAERKLLGSVGSVGILDVSRASAGTSHRPASRIPTLPVSATRGGSRRGISCDDFRGLDARSSNEDASYFDEAIPNDAFSSDRVPYESARVSRDARERDDAELRRQAAAAAMSAAEATPPRRADGAARRNVSLSRERRSRSSSLDSENSHREKRNPGSVSGAVPALSPLSALANASFADDTGSPGAPGVSSTGSGAFRVAVTSADDARAAPAAEKSSSPRFDNAAASAAASRWRSAYDSVAAAHETDSTRKKRSMYSRAAAAFGFAKKKPTARGRWQ